MPHGTKSNFLQDLATLITISPRLAIKTFLGKHKEEVARGLKTYAHPSNAKENW